MCLVKKGGVNSNQAHLSLPDFSKRRRCLLVEATQLAWVSWAATTSLFSPINRGRRAEKWVSPSGIQKSLEISEKNCFREKNPSRGVSLTLLRRFPK